MNTHKLWSRQHIPSKSSHKKRGNSTDLMVVLRNINTNIYKFYTTKVKVSINLFSLANLFFSP